MSLQLNRSSFGNPKNAGNTLCKDDANKLLNDWVKNDRLKLHMEQVAYLMKCWAAEKEGLNETDQWRWEMAGLLTSKFSAIAFKFKDWCAIRLIISLLVGSAIAWKTSLLILFRY